MARRGWDTLTWAEEQAANGLTATAAKAPTSYSSSGDTITLKKGLGVPYLFGIGMTSDTKGQASAVIPQYSNRNTYIYGPGSTKFADLGYEDMADDGAIELQVGETLTGYLSNTNVNEGSVLMCDVGYNGHPAPLSAPRTGRYAKVYKELLTITSAAAVSRHSGSVALSSGLTSTTFLNTKKNYELIGVTPGISAATLGGVLTFEGLSGDFFGSHPGHPVDGLSAVDFSTCSFHPFRVPLALSGEEFDSVTAGMCATTAGAITMQLRIGEL